MSSSIFNFEHFRRYAALPRAERAWHAAIAAVLLVVLVVCWQVPARLFGASGCPGATLESAAVDALSARTELLFVGSSHVLFGVRPQQYSVPAMNLAATWLDYTSARRVLEKNLPRVPNVKVVVLEYDELPLVSDLVPAAINRGDLRSLTELGLSPLELPVDDVVLRLRVLYVAAMFRLTSLPRLTPLGFANRLQACGELQHPLQGFAPGYYYTENVTPPTFDAQVVYTALAKASRDGAVVQRNIDALQQTIALLRSRGVTVVLLRLPHRERYVRGYPAVVRARWAELQRRMEAEARADPGVVLLDWSQRPEFRDRDFCDDHHLNVFGANKLAALLDGELSALCRGGRTAAVRYSPR